MATTRAAAARPSTLVDTRSEVTSYATMDRRLDPCEGCLLGVYYHCKNVLLDIYAASLIFILHLTTFETFLVLIISLLSTLFYFWISQDDIDTDSGIKTSSFGASLDWVLVSFAVVSPMIMQIKQAFNRREMSLHILAEIKSISMNIMLAHAIWDWPSNGGRKNNCDLSNFNTKSFIILKSMLSDVETLLTLPTFNRARHRVTSGGKQDVSSVISPQIDSLRRRIDIGIKHLHLQIEVLKRAGLPANEASRANQYNWFLLARIERLLNFKFYRTPQATRSFTRVSILLLPMFYGPYYVHVASENSINAERTNIYFACALSTLTSMLMIGVFNVERAMEDPFTQDGLDDVRVTQVFKNMQGGLEIALQSCSVESEDNGIVEIQLNDDSSKPLQKTTPTPPPLPFLNDEKAIEVNGGVRLDNSSFLEPPSPVGKIVNARKVLKTFSSSNNNSNSQVLAYDTPPEEIYNSTSLNLALWSVIINDSCLLHIADLSNNKHNHNSGFTSLDINGAEGVSDRGIAAIAKSACHRTLLHLNIGRIPAVSDATMRLVCTSLVNLTSLNISYTMKSSSSSCFTGVANIGTHCKSLEHLYMSGNTQIPEWVLLRIVYGCHLLQSLDVSFIKAMSDNVLGKITSKSLRFLDLRGCEHNISDAGLTNLKSTSLTKLLLNRSDFQYKITDVGCLAISSSFKNIVTLSLYGCDRVSDVGVSWVVSECIQLSVLDLAKCERLTDIGLRVIGESLLNLSSLNISYCHRITDAGLRHSANCTNLKSLDLTSLPLVSFDSVVAKHSGIPSVIKSCVQLSVLKLSKCTRLCESTLVAMAKNNDRIALSVLTLSHCPSTTTKGLVMLLQSLSSSSLKELSLTSCGGVNDTVLKSICSSHKYLEKLEIGSNSAITNAGIKYLSTCKNLLLLDVSHNVNLNDLAVLEITSCEDLQQLNLSGCNRITSTGISWLAEKCKFLISLNLCGIPHIASYSLKAIEDCWKYGVIVKKNLVPAKRALDRVFIDKYGSTFAAACKIQSLFRLRNARRAVIIRRTEKRRVVTATKLQAAFRGRRGRRIFILEKIRTGRRNFAAKVIQRAYRVILKARAEEYERLLFIEEMRNKSASVIQRCFKSYKARCSFYEFVLIKMERASVEKRAAIVIQTRYRGVASRAALVVRRAAATTEAREQKDAATKLQSLFRAREARKTRTMKQHLQSVFHTTKSNAASKIQRMFKSHRVRRLHARQALAHEKLLKATLMIQRRWRARSSSIQFKIRFMNNLLRKEDAAVRLLQAAWRRKAGSYSSHIISVARKFDEGSRNSAAQTLQNYWKVKKSRDVLKYKKRVQLEAALTRASIEYNAACAIQARVRGFIGRRIYKEKLLSRKARWKQIKNEDSVFYYNQDSGEIRHRMPQDMLDTLPIPTCNNCESVRGSVECRDCAEVFCEDCHVAIHRGGKRKSHVFRALFDYYNRRVDYYQDTDGDGNDDNYPCMWPSEIEQNELRGVFLRTSPDREPVAVYGDWEEYDSSRRKWYYNTQTQIGTYDTPDEVESISSWAIYYDEVSQCNFYYNSVTGISTFDKPAGFVVDSNSSSEEQDLNAAWSKEYDSTSNEWYYYNSNSGIRTGRRPHRFLTPRDSTLVEEGAAAEWAKYYDETSASYFYYNSVTNVSTFARPTNFSTPRTESVGDWEQFWDDTSQAYFYYNASTGESTFSAPSSSF